MRVTDRISVTKQRATTADALAGLKRIVTIDNQDEAFALALEEACQQGGIDFAFAYSHCANETDYYRDSDFVRDHNPAGIGHPDNASGGVVFKSKRAGARFYVWELLVKMRMGVPAKLLDAPQHAPAKANQVLGIVAGSLGPFPTVTTIADLGKRFGPNNREAVWFTDPNGAQAICAKGNAIFDSLPDQQTGGPVPGPFSTAIPGLPGGPLVTEYPVHIALMAIDGFQRPGTKARTPRRSVQHGTGNPNNPNAMAEARYFINGAEGRQASVHYCTDDTQAVVVVPLDEVTWQAADGSGPGNLNGFSCEMMEATVIWNTPARRDALIALTADLMGRTAARLSASIPEQHFDFNAGSPDRHDCPNKLRHTTIAGQPAWDIYARIWREARIDELRRMGGQPTQTTTTPPIPAPFPPSRVEAPDTMLAQGHELAVNKPTRFICIHGGRFKTGPSLDAPDAMKTPYASGKRYTFGYRAKVDGENWLVSKAGSWAPMKNFRAA